MANFLTRIFGSRNQRLVRQYAKSVETINSLEEGLKALDDEAHQPLDRVGEWRQWLAVDGLRP